MNQVALEGGFQKLRGIRDAEFFHHICPMRLYRLHADMETITDLPILEAIPNQLQNLLLALRQ